MPITFSCECGRTLRVKDEHAGKRIRCPGCSAVQTVPAAEAVTAEPVTPPPAARPKAAVTAEPARPKPARPGKPRPKLMREDANEDIDRYGERVARKRGSGSMLEKGVLGGLAMMGIAVVWFVGGLFAGILFYYPPILFIIGLICFIKGLIDGR